MSTTPSDQQSLTPSDQHSITPSDRCSIIPFSQLSITRRDVTFVRELHKSKNIIVFQVTVRGLMCVMKVYRHIERQYYHTPFREIDPFTCESTAYRRLKARGLCDRGIIPNSYGVIEQMDPMSWLPYLDKFRDEETRPSSVFVEYIPDAREFDLDIFTKDRMAKVRAILDEIHSARVLHHDPAPRNILVQEGSDRVLWIDFDVAQTFSEEKPLTEMQQTWMEREKKWMDWFASALEEDYQEGKLSRTWTCYFERD
ncbi:hypothetical protein CC80DRAFT_516227 [Byssothecium circinans]|uniref:Protein kinase domain-containing protein n=1 Tax=Byssothecium circinans TaxID=147558 RepID=A0A6A5TXA9_9PLEO|nr:hypothetical protein CC80DRAFT_516227 [Byssothecium circinans]